MSTGLKVLSSLFNIKKWPKEEEATFMAKTAAIKCLVALARCCALSLTVGIISYAYQSWDSSAEIDTGKIAVSTLHMIVMLLLNLANAVLHKN